MTWISSIIDVTVDKLQTKNFWELVTPISSTPPPPRIYRNVAASEKDMNHAAEHILIELPSNNIFLNRV